MAILTGILLGLSTLAFIGPVLFYLLKSTLESGVKAGIAVAVGIIVGDIIYVYLAFHGARTFFEDSSSQRWIALAGGIILLVIGLKYVIKPILSAEVEGKIQRKTHLIYFLNGFMINFVNPFVFVVWLGFVSYNQSLYGDGFWTTFSLTVTLLTIFSTDLLKVFLAQKLTRFIKPDFLRKIFRVFGILMILFSIRLLVEFFISF